MCVCNSVCVRESVCVTVVLTRRAAVISTPHIDPLSYVQKKREKDENAFMRYAPFNTRPVQRTARSKHDPFKTRPVQNTTRSKTPRSKDAPPKHARSKHDPFKTRSVQRMTALTHTLGICPRSVVPKFARHSNQAMKGYLLFYLGIAKK